MDAASDSRESVRSLAVATAGAVLEGASSGEVGGAGAGAAMLKPLVSLAVARIGVQPFAEESEEVRLAILRLVVRALSGLGPASPLTEAAVSAHLDDLARLLRRAHADPNPDAKLAACDALDAVCAAAPGQVHRCASGLVRPVLGGLLHQRAVVRGRALDVLAACLPLGADGLQDLLTAHALPALERTGDDRSPAVRSALAACVGRLLVALPLARGPGASGEAVHARLVAVLLGRLADDVAGVRAAASRCLHAVGSSEPWAGIAADALASSGPQPPPEAMALPSPLDDAPPSAAARGLVVAVMDAALPRILEGMAEWTSPRRAAAAGALRSLVAIAGTSTERSLDDVIRSLLAAAQDDEQAVRRMAADTGSLLGGFCDPAAVVHAVLPRVRGSAESGAASDAATRSAALAVLSDTVVGMDEAQAAPLLPAIAAALADPALAALDPPEAMPRLLAAAMAVVDAAPAALADAAVMDPVARCLLGLQRAGAPQAVSKTAAATAARLAAAAGRPASAVYDGAASSVVAEALLEAAAWDASSPSRWLLDALCRTWPVALAPHASSLLRVMRAALDPSRAPEMRVSAIGTLRLLVDAAAAGRPTGGLAAEGAAAEAAGTGAGAEAEAAAEAAARVRAAAASVQAEAGAAAAGAAAAGAAAAGPPAKRARKKAAAGGKKARSRKARAAGTLGASSAFVADLDAMVLGEGAAREAVAGAVAGRLGSSSEAARAAADAELASLLGGSSAAGVSSAAWAAASARRAGAKGKKRAGRGRGAAGAALSAPEGAGVSGMSTGRAASEAARAAVAALRAQEAVFLGEEEADAAAAGRAAAAAGSEGASDAAAAARAAAAMVSGAMAKPKRALPGAADEAAAAPSVGSRPDLRPLYEGMRGVGGALLVEVLEPSMQWRVGRVAATMRKVAAAAALGVWEGGLLADDGEAAACLARTLPSCKACMSDDDAGTRALACGVLASALRRLAGRLDGEFARSVQEDLVRRLDDADDGVRLRACALLAAFSRAAPPPDMRGSPTQWAVDALLVHADDPSPPMAAAAAAAIEPWIRVDPAYVAKAAAEHRTKHRSPETCDRLAAAARAAGAE